VIREREKGRGSVMGSKKKVSRGLFLRSVYVPRGQTKEEEGPTEKKRPQGHSAKKGESRDFLVMSQTETRAGGDA